MSDISLRTRLRPLRRRWWLLGSIAGAVWAVFAGLLLLLLGGWLDLVWELSPQGRIALWIAAALLAGAFFLLALVRIAQGGRFPLLARRVDRVMGFGGAVLTGYELDHPESKNSTSGTLSPAVSEALARMAVEHASTLAATTDVSRVLPTRRTGRPIFATLILLGLLALLALLMPEMMRTQWMRFLSPYSDIPRFSNTTIEIEDPEKQVVYGDALDIRAAVRGEPVDSVLLLLEDAAGKVETLPMFPETDGFWRAGLAKVTEDAVYHVRAYHARSTKHRIEVLTVPQIEHVRFHVVPPAYTGRPSYEGPLPGEGLFGLPGTRVAVRATSNRPLSRGEITVTVQGSAASETLSPETESGVSETKFEMLPDVPGSMEVRGMFSLVGSGKLELRLFDTDGQSSRDGFSGGITLLEDRRPSVRIVRPPSPSLATPLVHVPVMIAAEDDYGIARVRLFRSLNDSRFLPANLLENPPADPVSGSPGALSRHFNVQLELPLSDYDLQPDDTIKLFVRVEDNDPAGAKGAESSVVLIEIISQEEFEKMVRRKSGMELMLSRYREASRRLEALKEEVEHLREQLRQEQERNAESGEDGENAVSEAIKEQLAELSERMKQEAGAIRKLAENPLPYDLDEKFVEEMDKAAKLADEAARAVEKMRDKDGLTSGDMQKQLEEIGKTLGAGKRDFDQTTQPPLELLAAVLPLKMDENRSVLLVMRQKDLAERLASLKERDDEEDPGIRARMRELEDEQRQIRKALETLLADIEEHANMLPELPELHDLRVEAMQFVEDLRSSGADTAMAEAQAGLAEYSGIIGYAKASEAARILEEFLSKCEGMGQCASDALGFQPGLGGAMNNTLQQLLQDMGFGQGMGSSGMSGAGSGIGAQRGGAVGLYGLMPGMSSLYESQGTGSGGQHPHGRAGSSLGADYDSPDGFETPLEGSVGGAAEAGVPLRYRQAVGRYFQRILEESENLPPTRQSPRELP